MRERQKGRGEKHGKEREKELKKMCVCGGGGGRNSEKRLGGGGGRLCGS